MKTRVSARWTFWRVMAAAFTASLLFLPAQPAQAQMDHNRDGFITFEDFDAFVDDFITGEHTADINADTSIDFDDFDNFITWTGPIDFSFYWMVNSRNPSVSDMDTETDLGNTPARRDCFIFYAQQFPKWPWIVDTRGTTNQADDVLLDQGVHVMFRDPETPLITTYLRWETNYSAWLAAHINTVKSVISTTVENPRFAGVITLDYERIYPSWDGLQRLSQGSPLLVNQINAWNTMLASIHAVTWNTAFNTRIGYTPPAGALNWLTLTQQQRADLAKKSYNKFANEFFVESLNAVRAVRPSAKVGMYNLPMSWDTNIFNNQIADNNAMAPIWGASDALFPSMYVQRYATADINADPPICLNTQTLPSANEFWYTSVMDECQRIRSTFGRANQKILPYTWWRYHNAPSACIASTLQVPFLRTVSLNQSIRLPRLLGADGLVIWGFLGTPAPYSYADDPAVVGPEIRNNWSPIMLSVLPFNYGALQADSGPWHDSFPWAGGWSTPDHETLSATGDEPDGATVSNTR